MYWNFILILRNQQDFDMTIPSLLKVFEFFNIPKKWNTQQILKDSEREENFKVMFSNLVWNATLCACLPERATIWLRKEQVNGECILYFIKLAPLNWKTWAFSQMEQQHMAQVEVKNSPKQWHSQEKKSLRCELNQCKVKQKNWAPGAAATVSCLPCSSRRTRSAEFSSTFFLAAASSSFDHCIWSLFKKK